MRKSVEAEVKKSPSIQICPNNNSGCNVVAIRKSNSSNNKNTVICPCKSNWCFGCQYEDHWPASCEAYKSYKHQTVSESRDVEGDVIQKYVIVKLCPSCRYPIEKFGGCDHMVCMCGATFCWRCTSRVREEAQEHTCRVTHTMKFFFGQLNNIYTVTKTSLEWSQKADEYNDQAQRVENKARYGQRKFFRIKPDTEVDEHVTGQLKKVNLYRKQSLFLLTNVYKLLRNICMEVAHRESKHVRARMKHFLGNLKGEVSQFEKALDVYNSDLSYPKVREDLKHCVDTVKDGNVL